jgi:hypothetical protein
MSIEELIKEIQDNIEWLSDVNEDDYECITIENLEVILSRFLTREIKLTLE